MKQQLNEDSSQMLFIDEPEIFSTQFFINTIISCDMQIQLYPLKHFLTFCTFGCDYTKKGLSNPNESDIMTLNADIDFNEGTFGLVTVVMRKNNKSTVENSNEKN